MRKHLVLVGGGHAHVEVLKQLSADPLWASSLGPSIPSPAITLISPEPNHLYSGMGPGMLGLRYRPDELAFPIRDLCAKARVRFMRTEVTKIDPACHTLFCADGGHVAFDLLSCNIGSTVADDNIAFGPTVFPAKPVRNLLLVARRVEELLARRSVRLAVIGGGAAAFEVAGNLGRLIDLHRRQDSWAASAVRSHARDASVTIYPGQNPLGRFAPRVRRLVFRELARLGVTVGPREYASGRHDGAIGLPDGTTVQADITVVATGVRAPSLFAHSGLTTAPNGELLVDDHLQSVDAAGIFGVGDCIQPERGALAKVGVYAVRQTPVLIENLKRALAGTKLTSFRGTQGYMLLFNLGTDRGVFVRRSLVCAGRWAIALKDRIDRSFARRYAPPNWVEEEDGTRYT